MGGAELQRSLPDLGRHHRLVDDHHVPHLDPRGHDLRIPKG